MSERLHSHHILFHRRQHEATEDNKAIRRKSGLIVPLPVDVHKDLHDNCPGVPPLDIFMARRVRAIIRDMPTRTPMEAIDSYSFAVHEAGLHPKAHPIEAQLGEVAIEAVRLQIPYIREAG